MANRVELEANLNRAVRNRWIDGGIGLIGCLLFTESFLIASLVRPENIGEVLPLLAGPPPALAGVAVAASVYRYNQQLEFERQLRAIGNHIKSAARPPTLNHKPSL